MYQHPSDWHNDTGVIRQAEEQGMGVILMRPLTSGVFQRLMTEAFPEIDVLDVGRLLLNYVLSDPYVDVALVGVREPLGATLPVCRRRASRRYSDLTNPPESANLPVSIVQEPSWLCDSCQPIHGGQKQ